MASLQYFKVKLQSEKQWIIAGHFNELSWDHIKQILEFLHPERKFVEDENRFWPSPVPGAEYMLTADTKFHFGLDGTLIKPKE